jgi:hypothetical protein
MQLMVTGGLMHPQALYLEVNEFAWLGKSDIAIIIIMIMMTTKTMKMITSANKK